MSTICTQGGLVLTEVALALAIEILDIRTGPNNYWLLMILFLFVSIVLLMITEQSHDYFGGENSKRRHFDRTVKAATHESSGWAVETARVSRPLEEATTVLGVEKVLHAHTVVQLLNNCIIIRVLVFVADAVTMTKHCIVYRPTCVTDIMLVSECL